MFLKAVFKLFIFDNIVSLWMLELHLAAYASLFDRSPSILLLPACRKLFFYIKKRHLLESIPSEGFFRWSFLSRWALSYPGWQQITPPCSGAGKEQDMMALEGCAALGEQAQSFTNQEVTCAVSGTDFVRAVWLLRDTERHSFPLQSPSPSLPLFLFFIFNYFLISKEKEICGRRQF